MQGDIAELRVRCGILAERLQTTRQKLRRSQQQVGTLSMERDMLWNALRAIVGVESASDFDVAEAHVAANQLDPQERAIMLDGLAALRTCSPPGWRKESRP